MRVVNFTLQPNYPRKKKRRGMNRSQSRSGHFEEEKSIWPYRDSKPDAWGRWYSRYTKDVTPGLTQYGTTNRKFKFLCYVMPSCSLITAPWCQQEIWALFNIWDEVRWCVQEMTPMMGPLFAPRMTDEWKCIFGGKQGGAIQNELEKNLAHFVHHRSHVDCPRANPDLCSMVKSRRRALTHCRVAPATVAATHSLRTTDTLIRSIEGVRTLYFYQPLHEFRS